MDETIRRLERQYQESSTPDNLEKLVLHLFRQQPWETWTPNDGYWIYITEYLDNRTINKWLNLYEDFTARTAIFCQTRRDLLRAQDWLTSFYHRYPIMYQGRSVNVLNEGIIEDPPAKIKIRVSDDPCFHFEASHQGNREINLHGQREGFVSLVLVEEVPDPDATEQPRTIDVSEMYGTPGYTPDVTATELLDEGWPLNYQIRHQDGRTEIIRQRDPSYFEIQLAFGYTGPYRFNVYSNERVYGGPEEGGWWWDSRSPLGTLWLGMLPTDRSGFNLYNMNNQERWTNLPLLAEAYRFLEEHYHIEEDDEDSLVVVIETEVPSETPHQRYE